MLVVGLGVTTAPATAAPSASASAATAQAAPYEVVPFRPRGSDDARLVKAWNAWEGRDHQRYTTVVGRFCGCQPEPRVSTQVEAGQVTSVTHLHADGELERHGYEMDELYRILRRAYDEADDVRVRYLDGVPVSIKIVYGAKPSDRDTTMSVRVRRTDEAAEFAYAIAPFRLRQDDRAVLARSWRAWRAAAITTYVATTSRQLVGGTSTTLRTSVDDTVVRSVEALDGPAPRHGYEVERLYRTLRSLYRTADSVRVRYDGRGVPRRLAVDPDAQVAGDELVMRVTLRAA